MFHVMVAKMTQTGHDPWLKPSACSTLSAAASPLWGLPAEPCIWPSLKGTVASQRRCSIVAVLPRLKLNTVDAVVTRVSVEVHTDHHDVAAETR